MMPLRKPEGSKKHSMEGVLPVPGRALRLELFLLPYNILSLNSGWQITQKAHYY